MRRPGIGALVAVVLAAAGLAACEKPDEFESGLTDRAGGAASDTGSIRLVERDVEAPEVFKAEEPGLWDGRPSLGGVWVAHPDVTEPERVLIRNEGTGTFVIGALFRRERENPGPRLQVSSDAASALGILPGAPTSLSVTALRRQETPDPAAATAPAVPVATPARTAPESAASESRVAQAPAPVRQAAQAPAAPASVAAQPLPTTADLAPRRPQAAPPATTPAAPAVAAAPTSTPAPDATGAEPRMSAQALAQLTATAEEAIARGAPAVAAAARPAQESGPAPRTVSAPAGATPPRAPAPAAQGAAGLDRPLVQIGIFSVQDNASRTARRMNSAGLPVNVLEEQSHGKTFWRVTLGPAATTDERARLLARAREMGFADAYAVRR